MSKITKYSFSDLYDMASGISSKKEQAGHGAPFVSFGTVFNNYFIPEELPDLMNTSKKEQEIYSIKEDDILITRTSETIDELAMSCVAIKDYPKATYSGFTKRLRPKIKGVAYSKYMAFYLRGYLFRKAVTNNAFMTLRASFNEDIFSFLKLYLPDYKQQVAIGDLLYKIEKKIQLNNKINDNLEQQVSLLYDYWFIQYNFPNEHGNPYAASNGKMVWNDKIKRRIPQNWKVGTILNYGNIVSGGTPSTSHPEYYSTDSNAWITPNDLSGNESNMYISHGERDITLDGINNSSATRIPKGSILISTRAPIGYIAISENEVCTNQGFKSIVPSNPYNCYYIYYFIKRNVPALAQLGTGTTFKEVSKDTLSMFPAPLIPDRILQQFNLKIENLCVLRRKNEVENKKLIIMRDWLLPMLMNGQAIIED